MFSSLEYLLQWFALALIAPSTPASLSPDWTSDLQWHEVGKALVFSAESRTIASQCQNNPTSFLHAHTIMQGFHEFYVDGKLVFSSGDPEFKIGSSLYNSADVPCQLLNSGQTVRWRVVNLTHSYSKVSAWPQIYRHPSSESLFNTGIQASSAGSLIFIGLLCSIIFFSRLPKIISLSLLGGSVFIGAFFTLSVPAAFSIEIPTIYLHRLHDSALWIGTVFIWILFHKLCNVPKFLLITHTVSVVLALTIIAISSTLDQSQVGSTVAFVSNLICLSACVVIQVKELFAQEFTRMRALQFFSVLSFCVAGINDILLNAGTVQTIPLFAAGAAFSFILVALTANERIAETYRERDHLKANLEVEVEEKTKSLREKSTTLEKTVLDLKQAQAEVLQSSKLASLGTLSAGLAHEINNSLNYPTGALPSLKRLFQKPDLTETDRQRAVEILNLMGDGLNLTSEIIKNLKRYSSGKIGELEDLNLKQVCEGVLLLLKNQLKDSITTHVNIDANLHVTCSRVGLSQALMNVIGNAADALKEQQGKPREIYIEVVDEAQFLTLNIRDTGPGIPENIISRVLDPFFTTKPQGKGTGLGLYIVNREMAAVGGTVAIKSVVGTGTTIALAFPKNQRREAA
jgi:signal transduction histidine kinase